MGKIYVGQTDLTIELTTNKNIYNAQSVKINYKKPNGDIGFFNGVIVNSGRGIIKYDLTSASDINLDGKWTIWATVTDAEGLTSIGEPATFIVYKEGQ